MKLSVTRQSIARCLKIILGNFLITGAYAFITVPNEIVNGGVTSFSMILGNWKEIFHRNRIQLFLLSHPVFRPARSGYAILVHPVIGMVLAGFLVGTGYYFCISSESTAVGFDVIALILNKKIRKSISHLPCISSIRAYCFSDFSLMELHPF